MNWREEQMCNLHTLSNLSSNCGYFFVCVSAIVRSISGCAVQSLSYTLIRKARHPFGVGLIVFECLHWSSMKLRMETRVRIASASVDVDMSEFLSTYPTQLTIQLKWKITLTFKLQCMYSNWLAIYSKVHPSHCCFNEVTSTDNLADRGEILIQVMLHGPEDKYFPMWDLTYNHPPILGYNVVTARKLG